MAAPIIFSGNNAKLLKQNLDFNGQVYVLSGSTDPTSSAVSAPKGSLYVSTNGKTYIKQDAGLTTNWLVVNNNVSPGDIRETSFSAANNQVVAADVTGLLFSNSVVRSFEVLLSIYVNATSPLYEVFTLRGIQRGSDWSMSQTSTGDNSLVSFSITNLGQIQYQSGNYSGFSSATFKFRATTTSV